MVIQTVYRQINYILNRVYHVLFIFQFSFGEVQRLLFLDCVQDHTQSVDFF